ATFFFSIFVLGDGAVCLVMQVLSASLMTRYASSLNCYSSLSTCHMGIALQTHTLSLTHTHTHTLSLSLSHPLTHPTHNHTTTPLPLTHPHTHTHTHTHTHSNTHKILTLFLA